MKSDYWDKPLKPRIEIHEETDIVAYAEKRGWWAHKFVTPGLVGAPDRIFIRRGRVVFIEVKKFGEKPRATQRIVMANMEAHGAEVYWFDNVADAMEVLR